jgi:hypothetical protein
MRRIFRSDVATNSAVVVVMGLLTAAGWWQSRAIPDSTENWRIDDLAVHLNDRGVKVRVVPVMEHGSTNSAVFLTTTNQSWGQLNHLQMIPERIKDWDGTVFCGRCPPESDSDIRLAQWGDCGERRGRFILFGDSRLRARIDAALREEATTPPSQPPPPPPLPYVPVQKPSTVVK